VSIFYCIGSGDAEAYSTLRVAEGVAFRVIGQNVLVLW